VTPDDGYVSGRHRHRLHRRTAAAAAAALAVLVVAVGLRFGLPMLADAGCTGTLKLTVAVAKDIAPSVQETAQEWAAGQQSKKGPCLTVAITPAEPSDVAAAISREQKASLSGLDTATGTVAVPDVWIADSSTWLVRLRAAVPGLTFDEAGSVALSPVVMAMPATLAEKAGWPDRKLTFKDLVGDITTSTTLRSGIVEPARDAVGLSGLLALDATAGASLPGVLHALATGRSALRANLLQEFPQAADEASVASALGFAPLSEQDVITYNSASPSVPLAAIYPAPAPLPLDYPFLIMPGAADAQVTAADSLYQALRTRAAADRLGRAGFRNPDGTVTGPFSQPTGAPATVTAPAAGKQIVDPVAVNRALAGWSGVVAPARLLAVLDASKSMADPVSGAGDASRMAATLDAARGGLSLFSDDWQVGLWEFDGTTHRQLVPIGQLINNRSDAARSLNDITPHGADSGLYRTILDAYRAVQQGWQAGRVNSVLVMTDGVTGPKGGDLALTDLQAQLKALKDPGRPVQIVIVGVGDSVARAPLDEITRTVGGGVFVASDPSQVADVFSQAIALRVAVSR
jgi:Ca-activated chloride channel homolog